jgi:hypothetical protein
MNIKSVFVCKECTENKCKITIVDRDTYEGDPLLPKKSELPRCIFSGTSIIAKWMVVK